MLLVRVQSCITDQLRLLHRKVRLFCVRLL